MTSLRLALAAIMLLLVAAAWLVARKDRAHQIYALLLTWFLIVNWVRFALGRAVAGEPTPFTGALRLVFHADQLLYLSFQFLALACCVHYFLARRPTAIYGAWAAVWVLCLNYPLIRGDTLGWIYSAVHHGCLIGSWSCILWGMLRKQKVEPGLAHLLLMLMATTDVIVSLVPYTRGVFEQWHLVRHANLVLWLACLGAHAYWLATRARRPDTVAG